MSCFFGKSIVVCKDLGSMHVSKLDLLASQQLGVAKHRVATTGIYLLAFIQQDPRSRFSECDLFPCTRFLKRASGMVLKLINL